MGGGTPTPPFFIVLEFAPKNSSETPLPCSRTNKAFGLFVWMHVHTQTHWGGGDWGTNPPEASNVAQQGQEKNTNSWGVKTSTTGTLQCLPTFVFVVRTRTLKSLNVRNHFDLDGPFLDDDLHPRQLLHVQVGGTVPFEEADGCKRRSECLPTKILQNSNPMVQNFAAHSGRPLKSPIKICSSEKGGKHKRSARE